jgi:hypothetical protein
MDNIIRPNLGKFLLRFILVHLAAYYAISIFFILYQHSLPVAWRLSLAVYEPYRALDITSFFGQVFRALALGFALYTFYLEVFRSPSGKTIVFLTLWGLGLLGSVIPMPGSFEGIIYTTASFTEHASMIIALGVQMLIFVWAFFLWERYETKQKVLEKKLLFTPWQHPIKGYTLRFLVVHLVSYWVIGTIFFEFWDFRQALETMDYAEFWRSDNSAGVILLIAVGQIFRGVLLAWLLFPFYNGYINNAYGWLYLFMLLLVFTLLGTPVFFMDLVAFRANLLAFMGEMTFGLPEAFAQMMLFSVSFFYWQKGN